MKEIALWLKEIAIQLQILNRLTCKYYDQYNILGMLSEQSAEKRIHPTEKGGVE